MVIDTDVVKSHVKDWLHRITLIVIGAAAGLSSTVSDKANDYLEKTKDLPAIVDQELSEHAEEAKDVLVNVQNKADKAVTKVGKTAVAAGKKVDAVVSKASKKIQDKLKSLDELGCKVGSCKPPIPEPKPRSAGNWAHSPR